MGSFLDIWLGRTRRARAQTDGRVEVVDFLANENAPAAPLTIEVAGEHADRAHDQAFLAEIRQPRDEILTTQGKGDPLFYEKLLRDDQVYATFKRRRSRVVAAEWKVDPGGEQPIDKEAADHLREQLKRVAWDRACEKMLAGLFYGYGVGECMFKLAAPNASGRSLVELSAIKVRRPGRFRFQNDGRLRLLTEKSPEGILMPARKFWCYDSGADDDDNPYGVGLGHYLYWYVWFKRNGWKFWAQFLEWFSQPIPYASVPAGSNEEDRQKFLKMLRSITAGGRLVVPKGVEIELIQAATDSGGSYEKFTDKIDGCIAKIVLTQTMTTDNGSSLSQSKVHERGELKLVKSDADLEDESFTQGPAKWLTEWNFPGAATPRVYRDFEEPADLVARAQRDKTLNDMGWRLRTDRVADIYGDDYEYVAPAAPSGDLATTPDAPTTDGGAVTAPVAPSGVQLAPTDLATITTVNEARKGAGLPALTLPNGAPDPDGYLTVSEFKAKRAAKAETIGQAVGDKAAAAVALNEPSPKTAPVADASIVAAGAADDHGWRTLLGPEVEAVEALLDECDSLEQVRERLGELAQRDPEALSDSLARVLFAAKLSGEGGADDGSPTST